MNLSCELIAGEINVFQKAHFFISMELQKNPKIFCPFLKSLRKGTIILSVPFHNSSDIDPKLKKSFRGALNKTSMGGILGGILGNVRGVLGGSILDISIIFVI